MRDWTLCIGLSVCLNLCIIIYLLCSVSPIGCVHCIIPIAVWLSIGSLNVHSVIGIVHSVADHLSSAGTIPGGRGL